MEFILSCSFTGKSTPSESSIDLYSIPEHNDLRLTSSKGVALTWVSFVAQPVEFCVCPAFIGLTSSLAFHWPLLKSWTLNPLTPFWSSFQLLQYERALICYLSKPGPPSVLVWPLFKNLSNTCAFLCLCVCATVWKRCERETEKPDEKKTKEQG